LYLNLFILHANDKNHISTPFDLNIDASMGLDISNININTSNNLILLSFEDEDDEFIGTNYT